MEISSSFPIKNHYYKREGNIVTIGGTVDIEGLTLASNFSAGKCQHCKKEIEGLWFSVQCKRHGSDNLHVNCLNRNKKWQKRISSKIDLIAEENPPNHTYQINYKIK